LVVSSPERSQHPPLFQETVGNRRANNNAEHIQNYQQKGSSLLLVCFLVAATATLERGWQAFSPNVGLEEVSRGR